MSGSSTMTQPPMTFSQIDLLTAGMDKLGKKRPDRVDDLYKILLIGDMSVGKTGLLMRFADNVDLPVSHMPTIGIDFKVRIIQLDGKQIKLQLWDTAGNERFRTLTKAFYRGTHGLVIVYDVTSKESFENVLSWLTVFRENAHTDSPIPVMLVGNKTDQQESRVISKERAERIAIKNKLRYMETSAKAGINVDEAFFQLAKDIKKYRDSKTANPKSRKDSNMNTVRIRPTTSTNKTKFSWISKFSCSIL